MAGFVPTPSTWKGWSDLGFPNSISTPISANTVTYKTCDGIDLIDINVTIVMTGITRVDSFVDGVAKTTFTQHVIAVSDIAPPSQDVSVKGQVWRRADYSQCTDINNQNFARQFDYQFIIPVGATQSTVYSFELEHLIEYVPCSENEQWSFDTDAQLTIPVCNPASTCTLGITGTTIITPTFKGGTNGSIEVFVSGSTGTTQYSLNGGTPQVSNIFTGLGAGSYTILVQEDLCYDSLVVVVNDGEFRTSPFIVTEPNDFLASENPIVTTLSTATNTGIPQSSVSTFTFDAGIKNDYKVVFNLTAPTQYSATFIAKDFPNRESYFVTTSLKDRTGTILGVNTVDEVADSFADAIGKDINLSRYYYISVDNATVTLTAKEERTSMNLTSSNIDVLDDSGNTATTGITLTLVQSGNDEYEGSLVNDYSLYTDIYVGDGKLEYGEVLSGGVYQNYSTLELPFNIISNVHQFDASEIMKSFVYTPKIDLTFTGFTYITSMLRPMYVRYGEKYPLVANENTKKKRSKGETGYKWVVNSSLDWESANDMSKYSGITSGAYLTNIPFLTNSPNPLEVQRIQTAFLYFLIPKDYGHTLDLRGDIYYYDGTVNNSVVFFDITTNITNSGGVYALNVSYDTLGLAAYEASNGSNIKRVEFSVWADNGTTRYSETKTYRFAPDNQPRKFGVSFLNDLGGYDTFDFIGNIENTIDKVSKNYTIPKEIQSDGSSPEGFKNNATYDTKVTKKIVVNTGWIDRNHFDWLIELLKSNNIYSYSEPRQNYLNVSGSPTYKKSSIDDIYNIDITFIQTLYENSISI